MDALRPLSLDQFAAMTAEMETGFPRDRVLESANVSVEQWELTQETWLLRMAKQGSQRKLALIDRYNELLAKHRKAAQRKMRAEKRKLKGPMPVPAEAHLSPLARADDAAAGATFQKGQPGGDGAPRPSFAAAAAPAGPAWIASPAIPPAVLGAPATPVAAIAAPSILTPPPVAAIAAPPADTLDEDDYDEGATGVGPVPEALSVATAGPAWLASGPRPSSERTSGSPENVPAGPFAPVGPAWLTGPRGAPPAQAAAKPATVPPMTAQGIATPATVPPMTAPPAATPAAPPTRGPAWLQSSAGLPGVVPPQGGAPPAAAGPPIEQTMIGPPPRRGPRGATLSEASGAGPSGPAWLAAGPRAEAPPRAPEVGLPFQRTDAPAASATPPPAQAAPAPPASHAASAPALAGAPPAPPPRPSQTGIAAPAPIAPSSHAAAPPARVPGTPPPHASAPPAHVPITPSPQASAPPAHVPIAPSPQALAPPPRVPITPPQKPAQVGPRLSIEQLAWLQAQMEASPELGRAAREKLSLSEADYTAERAFWQARFQQDRATVERYSQLFYHYRRAR